MANYTRFQISTEPAPNVGPHPHRFNVSVDRVKLAGLLLKEFVHFRGDLDLVLSRPCVYGVFSGPIGGFAPRAEKCVGCLRCTVQYPDMVTIEPNPDRINLGDSYFSPDQVDTVLYEAATGRVPVRGAGYRGGFGGQGWDGMWTDMSEIVRPTRDGIHGREFISTTVDIGGRDRVLEFGPDDRLASAAPAMTSVEIPMLLDPPPVSAESGPVLRAFVEAAQAAQTMALMPSSQLDALAYRPEVVVPVLKPGDEADLPDGDFKMVELLGWDLASFQRISRSHPHSVLAVRIPFGTDIRSAFESGVRVFHLTADYHGKTATGFVLDAIRDLHTELVQLGIRQQVTLIGSGGIVAAEHVPKAIICGLDLVALDTAPLVALQGRFVGECVAPDTAQIELPRLETDWARQRVQNLLASWHDQLLEILGAMGLREVRRLRGETGRAMFQTALEREAFAEIEGYPHG